MNATANSALNVVDNNCPLGVIEYIAAYPMEIATFILAICTFLAVLAAMKANKIAKQTLDSMYKPNIYVVVEPSDSRGTLFFDIVIRNFGNAPATDVTFTLSQPIPSSQLEGDGIISNGPLITGIHFLPQGGERKIIWGTYYSLEKKLQTEITITCSYKDVQGKAMPETQSILDIESFRSGGLEEPPLSILATEVKNMNKTLKDIKYLLEQSFKSPY